MLFHINIKYLAFAAFGLTGLTSCATTPNLSAGNALPGIGLGASGDAVLLSWTPDGPLGQQLRTNSNLQLVASYMSDSGKVTAEPVSKARVGAQYFGVKFDLPDKLNNIATGPVCFQMVNKSRPIPIRIALPGESSAGFYYPEWVSVSNEYVELARLKSDKASIEQNVSNFQAGDPAFTKWKDSIGVTNRLDCKTLSAQRDAVRPETALTGNMKYTATRQQCVALFDELTKNLSGARPGLTPTTLALETQAQIPAGNSNKVLADALISDISKYGSGRNYFKVASLPLNDSSVSNLIRKKGEVNQAIATSLVEAYDGCLAETEQRFTQAYTAWQNKTDTNINDRLSETLQRECSGRFDGYEQRESRLQTWLSRQATINQDIADLERNRTNSLPTEKPLIGGACPFE